MAKTYYTYTPLHRFLNSGLVTFALIVLFAGVVVVQYQTNLSTKAAQKTARNVIATTKVASSTAGCLGDINQDNLVDEADFVALSNKFLQVEVSDSADLNGDMIINLADFQILAQNFHHKCTQIIEDISTLSDEEATSSDFLLIPSSDITASASASETAIATDSPTIKSTLDLAQ